MKQKILVADDEGCIRFIFSEFLQGGGCLHYQSQKLRNLFLAFSG